MPSEEALKFLKRILRIFAKGFTYDTFHRIIEISIEQLQRIYQPFEKTKN